MTERDAHLQLLVDGTGGIRSIQAMEQALEKLAQKADKTQEAISKVGARKIQVSADLAGIQRATAAIKELHAQLGRIKPISVAVRGMESVARLSTGLSDLKKQIEQINSLSVGPRQTASPVAAGAGAGPAAPQAAPTPSSPARPPAAPVAAPPPPVRSAPRPIPTAAPGTSGPENQEAIRQQIRFANERIALARRVARIEMASVEETMAFRRRMLEQQRTEESRRRTPAAPRVVLGDPDTASPRQTMAFQSRMQAQQNRTTGRDSGQMDRIRAAAEAENIRRDQAAYDAMRREAEAENRARSQSSRQYTRMRAAAEAENISRDQRAYDNMRREAEAENARRNQDLRRYTGMRAAAEAENIRRDQQAYARMRAEAEAENARRTRESRRYAAMRAQAEAENVRFDRQAMAATRAEAEAENRSRERAARQASSQRAKADRERRSNMVPSSSSSFVGPMPETRRQVQQRQETAKAATYDASVAIEQSMKKLSGLAMPKFDTGLAVKHAEKLSDAFAKVGSSVANMNSAIAGLGIIAVGQSIARAGMAMESLRKGLDVASGSSAQGAVEMDRLRKETDRLGVDLQHTGKEYVNFVAAVKGGNVDAEKAKDSFFAVAQAMSVLGRSPESASRAFKALEQFASKGQVMSEELKGQLAEQLPGAFAIAAKSLGMSAEELGNSMSNGAVSANQLFAVFGDAVRGNFAIAGDRVDSATASFTRFNNALFEIKATIANGGFLKGLADGADQLAAFLKSDIGQETANQLGGALKSAIDTLIGGLKLLIENAEVAKAAFLGLVGLAVGKWVMGIAAAVGELAVQFALLARFMMAHPLFAVASVALAGAAAIYTWSKAVSQVTKAQLEHNKAVKDLKQHQEKLNALVKSNGSQDEIAAHRAAITAIRDRAREEQKRYDDNIKKAKELRKYEESMSKTGLGAETGGLGPGGGDIAAWLMPERYSQGSSIDVEKQRREMQLARQREQAAQRALLAGQPGFTGRQTGAGTQSAINDRPMAENLIRSLAEVERLIAEQEKLASAFEKSAAAAAEIKSELEMASKIKEFDGKVSAEGLEQLKAKYQELRDVKEQVAAGPILQEMRQSISDLEALSSAHNRGVDAANAERIAQDARNKVVEAGIRVSSDAANEIFRLAQAHEQAAQSEFMSGQRAQVDRNIQREQRLTDVLVNKAGTPRIAGQGELKMADTLAERGIQYNPEDGRPTVENAEKRATVVAGGQEEVVKVTEQRKRTNAELEIELSSMTKIAALERGRSEGKARQAGELRALIDLRKELGNVEMKDLTPEDKKFVELRGKQAAEQFKITQGNRVGGSRAAPQDIYGEKLRELNESIEAEKGLAAAQMQGAEATEAQIRKQSIMNQVHSLSEKLTSAQKAKLEELIGTLYDAKTASAFEGAKMDLRDEIGQIQAMTAAELQSAEAANIEAIAQEARQRAIELNGVANAAEVKSLQDLMAARLRANQEREIAQGTRANRDVITELEEEREALKLVGVERIRRLGQLQAEQELRSRGTPRDTKGADAFVESGGNRAVEEYNDAQIRSIDSAERSIGAVHNQTIALGLLGEAHVRRSAELQMEAQLIEQNGSATDDFSQKQITLAGDLAVATDQMNRQNDALRQLANSGLTFNEMMRSVAHDGLMSMEDALVDIITGTKGVKEAFADMAKSIAADLARMAIRQAITVPLAMGLNSLFMGGAAAAPAFGGFASAASVGPIAWSHTGGIVGKESTKTAIGDLSVFSNAPRYHTGKPGSVKAPAIKAGEVPTILKRDEGVFTPQQMAKLAPAGSGGGSSPTIVLSPTIHVTQPQGATEEQGQKFGKGIVREMQAMVDERINHAFRPGGIRNQSGY